MFARRAAAKILSADDDVAGAHVFGVLRLDLAKNVLGEFERVDGDVKTAGNNLVRIHVFSKSPGFSHNFSFFHHNGNDGARRKFFMFFGFLRVPLSRRVPRS